MILFRTSHPDFPFLWESPQQPAGRWHGDGDGPVHYFATTPDGAWAEVIRHEEITDPEDLRGLRGSAMWVVEIDDASELDEPALDDEQLTGGMGSYVACRAEARRQRERGSIGLYAPSAALAVRGAVRYSVDGGLQLERVDSRVVVLFGRRPDLKAQLASIGGHPDPRILAHVRRLTA